MNSGFNKGEKKAEKKIPSEDIVIAASQSAKERKYWLKQFTGELVKSSFPYDGPSLEGRGYEFYRLESGFTNELFDRLMVLRNDSDYTLHMILTAVVVALLYKCTGRLDIIVGTPVDKQEEAGGRELINSVLALRNQLTDLMTFKELLLQVRQTILQAVENQNYPFETLLYDLNLSAVDQDDDTGSESRLFDAALLLENIHDKNYLKHIHKNILFCFRRTRDSVELVLEYNSLLYRESTAERLINYIRQLMRGALFNVEVPLMDIDILPGEERRRLLFEFNDTFVEYPVEQTLHGLFEEQVAKTPDHIAVVGPMQEKNRTYRTYKTYITYRELNEKSAGLARLLREKGVRPDTITAIMLEQSVEMIIGILAILKAGGAYMPIDPEYPQERIDFMLRDSEARILLLKGNNVGAGKSEIRISKSETNSNDQNSNNQNKTIASIVLDFEHLNFEFVSNFGFRASDLIPSNLAYTIYTSGSTGMPKGVLVEHGQVVNTLTYRKEAYQMTAKATALQLFSYVFDGFLTSFFTPIISGVTVVMSEAGHTADVAATRDVIMKYGVTHFISVPALYRAILEGLSGKDLATLEVITLAGDIVSPQLLELTKQKNKNIELAHEYGVTEAAVMSTLYRHQQRDNRITIGHPIGNTRMYIVNRNHQLQPIGIPGELCIGGAGVARGYLNNPELTNKKFLRGGLSQWVSGSVGQWVSSMIGKHSYESLIMMPRPHPETNKNQHKRFAQHIGSPRRGAPGRRRQKIYKTGDLARWFPDGNIEFLGRIDHQVKIRGIRVESGEIEAQLLRHEKIKEAVVTVRADKTGNQYLCAYIVARGKEQGAVSVEDLREHLSHRLPAFLIPTYFVRLEEIPLSSNGKVDRKGLPEPEITAADRYTAPRDEIETQLAVIWAEVLGTEQSMIGIDDNFFESGGHSLLVTQLVLKIEERFHVKVAFTEVFRLPLIRQLSQYIKDAEKKEFQSIARVETREYYPVSAAQKRMFLENRYKGDDTRYNTPGMVLLEGNPDYSRIREAINALIRRHETLRTSFELINGIPVQRVHREVDFEMKLMEAAESELQEIIKQFIRPFDLSKAPLLRINLVKDEQKKNRHIFMYDMHHIIGDALSMDIFGQDLVDLYERGQLPGLKIQYKEFTFWQNNRVQSNSFKEQEEYWIKVFTGDIPVLDLPTDFPRPEVHGFAGDAVTFDFSEHLSREIRKIAVENGGTLFAVLLAIFNILLSRYGSQEDIIVGTPLAGRQHVELEQLIGMFVNTLVIRNQTGKEKTFYQFLEEVKNNSLKAFENQDYQFEELVNRLGIKRDLKRHIFFDVMFAEIVEDRKTREKAVKDLVFKPYEFKNETIPFDLLLYATDTGDNINFKFIYCTQLFKKETIERMAAHFIRIAETVDGDTRLKDLELLTAEEIEMLVYRFNDTAAAYPRDKMLQQLFEEQAEKGPDNIALISNDSQLTYRVLNERSRQMAGWLRRKDIGPGVIVAIMLASSFEMIFTVLAILKAGGAYLPIEPAYPEDRIDYMLTDSGAEILVTIPGLSNEIKYKNGIVHVTDAINRVPTPPHLHLEPAPATCLAYVIYTSGSTGRPKGVLVEHQQVVNTLMCRKEEYGMTPGDTALQLFSYAFDGFITSFFTPIISGAKAVLLNPGPVTDVTAVKDVILKSRVTHFISVPSLYRLFLESIASEFFAPLKVITLAGEAVSPDLVQLTKEKNTNMELAHEYGVTEAAVMSTLYRHQERDTRITIGHPVWNTSIHILDRDHCLQPPGIPGELCIGGDGLARGYLNNPELTAGKFISISNKSYKSHRSYIIYTTGDLGRWFTDGNIEFLGRMDNQVKVRGIRIEPGEIENQLMHHPGIKEAVVIAARDKKSDMRLVAYWVPAPGAAKPGDKTLTAGELQEYLSKKIPRYLVPGYFIQLERMPLTPVGKVDKKALLQEAETAGIDEIDMIPFIAPRDEPEEKLARLWAEVLGIEKDTIGIDSNFFQLGGHSLSASRLISNIHKELNVTMPMMELFRHSTIRELAKFIHSLDEDRFVSLEAVEKRDYYLLSPAQKRVFITQQMREEDLAFNLSSVVVLEGLLDKDRLEEIFQRLITRHESLRTFFDMKEGEPVQRVCAEIDFKIENYGTRENRETHEKIIRNFIKPFDLACPPLVRVGLIQTGESEHILMLDIHHIVIDGVSIGIFLHDLMTLYEGKFLSPPEYQYKDYASWQNSEAAVRRLKQQETFWLEQFAGGIPGPVMPLDYPRPGYKSFEGAWIYHEIDRERTEELKKLALDSGTTLQMVLLAIHTVLLFKYSGQEDIVVGTGIAGRSSANLERIIGIFINMLALRNQPRNHKSFRKFLEEVKTNTLGAYKNQDYPFDELVKALGVQGETSGNPLFDTVVQMQNFDIPDINIPGLTLRSYPHEIKKIRFDLVLYIAREQETLQIMLDYCTALFKESTIRDLVKHFIEILDQVLEDREKKLKDIKISTKFTAVESTVQEEETQFGF